MQRYRPKANTYLNSPAGSNQTQPTQLQSLQFGQVSSLVTDLTSKVRQLEVAIMDVKSATERRVQGLADELPSRMQREVRALEQKDGQLHKDHQSSIAGLQDMAAKLRQTQLQLAQESSERHQGAQLQANETRFKIDSIVKQLQVLEQSRYATLGSGLGEGAGTPGPGGNQASIEGSVASVKDSVHLERQKRDGQFEELTRQSVELQALVHGVKNELLGKIKEHRDEYLAVYSQSEEERQRMEKIRLDKSDSDAENTKRILATFDKKIEAEADIRTRNEEDLRKYIEAKFQNLQEQMKSDEKLALEREQRMMSQVQEGLVTMNDIIKGTKE